MERSGKRLWKNIGYVLLTIVFGVVLVGAQVHYKNAIIKSFEIKIDVTEGDDFLSPENIKEQVILKMDTLIGKSVGAVEISNVERVILEEEAVREANVYLNSKNELVAEVQMKKVLMRIKPNELEGYYIDDRGKVMRWVPEYTPKVLTIFGEVNRYPRYKGDTLTGWELNHKLVDDLFRLYQAVAADKFCEAQIGAIYINNMGQLEIVPSMGNQKIVFGEIDQVSEKLKKLKIFYKEIVKQAGWSKYETVNLKYKKQIVCK